MNYDEAKKAGVHRYEGRPCMYGHGSTRYVGSRKCVTCQYASCARRRGAKSAGLGYIARRARRTIAVSAALAERPLTTLQLSVWLNLSEHALRRLLASLVAEKVIHVHEWSRSGSIPCRVFALGEGKNAPRPAKLTPEQMQKRWRDARPKYTPQQIQRDPLTAALFGPATQTEKAA